jgi:SAM-dependent methyltransferase
MSPIFHRLWETIHWRLLSSSQLGRLYSRLQFWDDYNWETYTSDYSEMLKAKFDLLHTQRLRDAAWRLESGKILLSPGDKPLHVNHRLLYELVIKHAPARVLEFGCGGGDHLSNIRQLLPGCALMGIDRSPSQIELLKARNPDLLEQGVSLRIADLTRQASLAHLRGSADLVYSQAVLMHIHGRGRPARFVSNMVCASRQHVILIENSRRHNYVHLLRSASGREVQLVTRRGAFALLVDLKDEPTYSVVRNERELDDALKVRGIFEAPIREGSPLWSYLSEAE